MFIDGTRDHDKIPLKRTYTFKSKSRRFCSPHRSEYVRTPCAPHLAVLVVLAAYPGSSGARLATGIVQPSSELGGQERCVVVISRATVATVTTVPCASVCRGSRRVSVVVGVPVPRCLA